MPVSINSQTVIEEWHSFGIASLSIIISKYLIYRHVWLLELSMKFFLLLAFFISQEQSSIEQSNSLSNHMIISQYKKKVRLCLFKVIHLCYWMFTQRNDMVTHKDVMRSNFPLSRLLVFFIQHHLHLKLAASIINRPTVHPTWFGYLRNNVTLKQKRTLESVKLKTGHNWCSYP
jgi:hypothetical protein